jgi:hypothetical protein
MNKNVGLCGAIEDKTICWLVFLAMGGVKHPISEPHEH